jgi:hypothetical protein
VSALVITYAVTEDNFNGTPWMPDGDDFWSVVARDHGRTKWRHITAASRVDLAANGARVSPGDKTNRTPNMISETQNLPTAYVDPVEELAAEARNNIENTLKFVKGEWTINDEKVPDGVEFVAYVDHLVRGWIRFDDQKVAERILVRRGDRQRLPEREDLSYAEESEWPRDSKGKARDPWVKQFFVPLLNTNDEKLVTFVTGSVGGRIAVGKLCDAFLNNDRKRPIIKLDISSFKSKEYGKVESPAFQIIGYEETPAEQPTAPPDPTTTPPPAVAALPAKKKTKKGNGDMDDEIPF